MERAVAELKAARQAWGVWAEGIGQRAERRLGVTGLGDLRVMDDPEYARALDVGAPFIEAVSAAEAALKAGRRCGRSLASRQSPQRLAGDAGGDVPAGLPAVPDKHK